MQQALFETAAPTRPMGPRAHDPDASRPTCATFVSRTAGGMDVAPPVPGPLQRWWRLQGEARRRGRTVEPLLVTPRFLARIDTTVCPVTREPIGPGSAQIVALRPDAALAAGHLVTLSATAAAALTSSDGGTAGAGPDPLSTGAGATHWADAAATARRLRDQPGAREAGLDATAWGRLAVLRSFVQPLTPAQVATLPLLVLPPNRVRVLSAVQGLQVAATLALRGTDRAVRLLQLATLPMQEDQRQALRVLVLTLLARCPAGLDSLAPRAARQALEDLWQDALLQRRWERLALRLSDAQAESVLQRAHATRLLGPGWRPLEAGFAVDGWDLPAARRGESRHVRRTTRGSGPVAEHPSEHRADSRGETRAEPRAGTRAVEGLVPGPARNPERRVAGSLLAPDGRRHGLDAAAAATLGR